MPLLVEQILVLTAPNEQQLPKGKTDLLLHRLPLPLIEKAGQFGYWRDRQASLLGKGLLLKGLEILGETPGLIHNVGWDRYRRPFITGGPDFNIAHAGGLVLCALVKGGRIGIDVEAVRPIDLTDYTDVFTAREMQFIASAASPVLSFFDLWTRKEAVLKADGRGFYLDPRTFDVCQDVITVGNAQWTVKKLEMPSGYSGHLACSVEKNITERYLEIEELLT